MELCCSNLTWQGPTQSNAGGQSCQDACLFSKGGQCRLEANVIFLGEANVAEVTVGEVNVVALFLLGATV